MKDTPALEHHKGRRISIRSMKKEAERVRASSYWRCGMSKGTFSGVKVTVLWVTYVLLGSLAFQYIEETTHITETTREHHHWARFKGKCGVCFPMQELRCCVRLSSFAVSEHSFNSFLCVLLSFFPPSSVFGKDSNARVEVWCKSFIFCC